MTQTAITIERHVVLPVTELALDANNQALPLAQQNDLYRAVEAVRQYARQNNIQDSIRFDGSLFVNGQPAYEYILRLTLAQDTTFRAILASPNAQAILQRLGLTSMTTWSVTIGS